MRLAACLCALLIVAVLSSCIDARKTFSTRRKSGSNRRGGSTSFKQKQAPPPVTPQKVDSFLKAERAGSSHGSSGSPASPNTHYRGNVFENPPKQSVPQTNGPIGFEKVNQGNQKPLGFDKVNSEAQQKSASSHIPSAPAYPGKPPAGAPNGPPPAYPGYGSPGPGSHGGFEPPPAYPGRPVNAPPVYSANNPSFGQKPAGYPGQNYPGQSYPGQQNLGYPNSGGTQNFGYPNSGGTQNFGYPNSGGNFGNYPNQGFGQGGFGSHPSGGYGNWNSGGYGQSSQGFGGNPYGGSPFGHSNPYGGSPFGGHTPYGGSGFGGNPHYSPNNFGFSNNPGFFGSSHSGFGGNNMGYHKKSRWGGLPIPIPIPIPIPMGLFGGWGGRSHNHRVLDTFVKNQTLDASGNVTTNVYILNNSTVAPCTTDQFIYESLNVTVISCTAGNCSAIKVFTTTNVSGEVSVHSAGITMCLENNNTTYSSFADNVNPTVSDLHKYWMRVCKDGFGTNTTGNVTEQAGNVTIKIEEIPNNETVTNDGNTTTTLDTSSVNTTATPVIETTTVSSTVESSTTSPPLNSTIFNATLTNSSSCEIFNCSWIEMCLPSIELVDRCSTPDCPFTRTGYKSCIRIKMCNSPSTPVSMFATLNNTISRIDQFNNVTSVNDVANLTLISYIPPTFPANCSQNATDPACLPPVNLPREVCNNGNSSETNNGTLCAPPAVAPPAANLTEAVTPPTVMPTPFFPDFKALGLDDAVIEEIKRNMTAAYNEMAALRKQESDKGVQS